MNAINGIKSGEFGKYYMKIKLYSDYNMLLKKILKSYVNSNCYICFSRRQQVLSTGFLR